MKINTIIWDFDGTLIPNDPCDSEQTLMMYKMEEFGGRRSVILHAMARLLIYADQKEFGRRIFKQFLSALWQEPPSIYSIRFAGGWPPKYPNRTAVL